MEDMLVPYKLSVAMRGSAGVGTLLFDLQSSVELADQVCRWSCNQRQSQVMR